MTTHDGYETGTTETDVAEDLLMRIGQMTRMLRDSMRELGLDHEVEKAAQAIPDARDRLNYVASMTEQAAANRIDGVNTAMAYGTDGQLAALGLVVLEDSLHVQPVYRPAPLVRKDFLDRHPEIAAILAPVFRGLDLETLQELNARVAVGGEEAGTVAEDYLRERDFLR